ncbi:UNVERIFIED_ORG: hypothetical protein GGI63_005870 [Rhizobium esperanzae]
MIPTNFGGNTGKTQEDLGDERKRLAYAMLQQGMDTGPVKSPWEGAARLVQALMGGLAIRKQEQQAADAEAGSDDFPPLPDNPPIPGERPLYPDPAAAEGAPGEPMAPAAQPGAGLFAPLPDNPSVSTPKPYRDPLVTTDCRREQPIAADQPGENAVPAPPANVAISTQGPGYPDSQMTTDERRQQPATPAAGGGAAGSANDGGELKTILSDPARRAELPAGMRNNNPTNLKYAGQRRPGIIGPSENTDQGDPQVVYATPEAGMEHNVWQIMKKYREGMLTPNQIIAGKRGWTPDSFTAAANVAQMMGIGPDDDLRLNDPAMAKKFVRALITQEQGTSGALYPDSMIEAAIAAQNAGTAHAVPAPTNVPIPTQGPEYRDPQMTTDERRQQPAAPAAGGGAAGSANDGGELKTILSDPVRRAELPPGMRNNNPTNLKYAGQRRPGIIGPSENTDQGDPQVVYATPEAGMEHNVWQIMKKYREGMLTPNQIIAGKRGWTPDSFTAAANVAQMMGIGPDDDLRLNDPAMAKKFVRALITQEQGTSGALYPDSMIEAAIAAQSKGVAHAFPSLPATGPVPSPRPEYPDSQLTTDERRQQPAMSPAQPGDDPFAPPASPFAPPGNVPVPTPRPNRNDRQTTRGTPSQQPVDVDVFNGFMDTVKNGYKQRDGSIIKVTNPYGLAAIASTGQSESQFSAKRANGSWSDPSKSGKPGRSGAIMSWRNTRLQALYDFAAAKGEKPGAISPQTQAEFFLQEDPRLIARLNAAQSLEEAQRLMNRAWQFDGYDEPGNKEVANRLARAKSFLPQYQTDGAADPFALPDNPSISTPRPDSRNPRQTMNQTREGQGAALVRALLARGQSGLW